MDQAEDKPVGAILGMTVYRGTYRIEAGRLIVTSAWGSDQAPLQKQQVGAKEVARLMLVKIVCGKIGFDPKGRRRNR